MKLYVCWGKFPIPGHGHPCHRAYRALRDAGYTPEVVRSYGGATLPEIFNKTSGRQEVKQLTGQFMVPALVTDAGEVITESASIEEWARANPAISPAAAAQGGQPVSGTVRA